MRAVIVVIDYALQLYIWVLVAQAVLSWLLVFNVVNPRNQVVRTIWQLTFALTEPFLKPIRAVIRPFNGIDLSPMILILAIILIQQVLRFYVFPNVI